MAAAEPDVTIEVDLVFSKEEEAKVVDEGVEVEAGRIGTAATVAVGSGEGTLDLAATALKPALTEGVRNLQHQYWH
ncbi:hypothetical protein CFO_g261 [Ceratocystis platani]|uniref:Uncharacterized protein n=1 Tax=Ceratocystis fimbriata f. sp. platani TaxID=88771 RepID=A0A0F8B8T3_CERFI|nr:hypothetical protein CFO_g261 [Ceratocystis platani]